MKSPVSSTSKDSWWWSPWTAAIAGTLIGTAIYRHQADKEATARRGLLKQAVFLAEADKSRVVGVQLMADGQWHVVPLADKMAAFRWSVDVTHGGYRPDPGTFTVWIDKGEGDWRESAFAHATYGKGR